MGQKQKKNGWVDTRPLFYAMNAVIVTCWHVLTKCGATTQRIRCEQTLCFFTAEVASDSKRQRLNDSIDSRNLTGRHPTLEKLNSIEDRRQTDRINVLANCNLEP